MLWQKLTIARQRWKQGDHLGGYSKTLVADDVLNSAVNSGYGEKWLDSEYALKVEPIGFADSLDGRGAECMSKRKVRKDFEDTWPYQGEGQSFHLL